MIPQYILEYILDDSSVYLEYILDDSSVYSGVYFIRSIEILSGKY